jgi:Spy/CpxP family protein refolding chaperone
MHMKKFQIVLVAALVAMTASAAVAQDPQPQPQGQPQGSGQGRGGNRMAALMQGITLSADQQAKLDTLSKKFADQRQAVMQDQSLDQDARRAKMRDAMMKQADDIKALLTDEQKKVFEKNWADMQARMQGGGAPAAKPPQF